MKHFRIIIYTLGILLLASACTKDLSDLNRNPKAPISAPSAGVFLAGQKALVDAYTTDFWGTAPFRIFAQTWTETNFLAESHYSLGANNAPGGWWNSIYTNALANLAQAKAIYAQDVTDLNIRRNDLIITDILEVYAYSLLVNTYGNIPYSQALNRTIPFPAYDDARTVEYDLLSRLDTAIAGLNPAYGSLGSADQLYKGNVGQWKKFAASLKLKLALVIADIDAATASKKVQEAIATGLFQSNADNAILVYDSTAVINSNPIWQDLINNTNLHYYCPGGLLVSTMVGWSDPRLPLYFTKDPNGNYTGGIAGAGNSAPTLSSFSGKWLNPAFPGDLLDYSETQFLLAEATERGIPTGGQAAVFYDSAISASIQAWGGTHADALNYLALPPVNYTTAAGNWRQKIGYQKWISFANRNWDAWTEIRRLGYPNIDQVSPPQNAAGQLPLRFYYPPAEQSSNPTSWATAVKALPGGQDLVSAKLFWMQ